MYLNPVCDSTGSVFHLRFEMVYELRIADEVGLMYNELGNHLKVVFNKNKHFFFFMNSYKYCILIRRNKYIQLNKKKKQNGNIEGKRNHSN